MKRLSLRWVAAALAGVVLVGGGGAVAMLPAPPAPPSATPVLAAETRNTLAALRPPKRARPVIAVIGIADATETTDFIMPLSILRRSGSAEVWALSTSPGPIQLYPALRVWPDATTATFDARYPDGADYVIVPAMTPDDDPEALAWIRRQAERGAIIIGVCAGARVVANADLLDGRQATTHWYYLKGLLKAHPHLEYTPDRRFLVDHGVATTTGITASIPFSLTLIEAISGRPKALEVARSLGVSRWDAGHDSDAFRFNRRFAVNVMRNKAMFWRHQTLGLELKPGQDGVALALTADAWSRTYRSRVITHAPGTAPVTTLEGLRILPDRADAPAAGLVVAPPAEPAGPGLDRTLAGIERRYGAGTAEVVAMQLEYPRVRP
ncbi:MAG: transcriptional regulator [Brevundimonas sp.]|nr:MAG: transcriptional regulator [Brevundimonas sp.]